MQFAGGYLRNWKNDKGIEPKPPKGPHIVTRNLTGVPHELPAANTHRLTRYVSQLKLKQDVGQVQGIQTRPHQSHNERQRHVHVKTGPTALAQRDDVKEERIYGQRHAPCHEDDAVPPFDVLATWVDGTRPGQVVGAAVEGCGGVDSGHGGPGRALPLEVGLVGRVTAGGVEDGDTDLSASVAFF